MHDILNVCFILLISGLIKFFLLWKPSAFPTILVQLPEISAHFGWMIKSVEGQHLHYKRFQPAHLWSCLSQFLAYSIVWFEGILVSLLNYKIHSYKMICYWTVWIWYSKHLINIHREILYLPVASSSYFPSSSTLSSPFSSLAESSLSVGAISSVTVFFT